jgi:hypothetical protein
LGFSKKKEASIEESKKRNIESTEEGIPEIFPAILIIEGINFPSLI